MFYKITLMSIFVVFSSCDKKVNDSSIEPDFVEIEENTYTIKQLIPYTCSDLHLSCDSVFVEVPYSETYYLAPNSSFSKSIVMNGILIDSVYGVWEQKGNTLQFSHLERMRTDVELSSEMTLDSIVNTTVLPFRDYSIKIKEFNKESKCLLLIVEAQTDYNLERTVNYCVDQN